MGSLAEISALWGYVTESQAKISALRVKRVNHIITTDWINKHTSKNQTIMKRSVLQQTDRKPISSTKFYILKRSENWEQTDNSIDTCWWFIRASQQEILFSMMIAMFHSITNALMGKYVLCLKQMHSKLNWTTALR